MREGNFKEQPRDIPTDHEQEMIDKLSPDEVDEQIDTLSEEVKEMLLNPQPRIEELEKSAGILRALMEKTEEEDSKEKARQALEAYDGFKGERE